MEQINQQEPENPTPANPTSKVTTGTVAVVAIALVAAAGWYLSGAKGVTGTVLGADTSYQAVFLTNGQVYFGKLASEGDWIKLTDIYYLQVTQSLQQAATGDQAKDATPSTTGSASTPQQNIQLVKLGSELHGPQDEMFIDRDKVLFWENMKDDAKVVQAIHQHKNK